MKNGVPFLGLGGDRPPLHVHHRQLHQSRLAFRRSWRVVHGAQDLMDVEDRRRMLRLDRRRILLYEQVQRIHWIVRPDLRDQIPAHAGQIALNQLACAGQDLPGPILQLLLPDL